MTLTHLDAAGRASMVDVGAKPRSERVAIAEGRLRMAPETLALVLSGGLPKGDVIAVARIAGIQAAKQTALLIPLCHPLPLSHIAVDITEDPGGTAPGLRVTATVRSTGQTGVEMEALTAVSVALLTLYDMAKAVDRGMVIEAVALIEKRGGVHGDWRREGAA